MNKYDCHKNYIKIRDFKLLWNTNKTRNFFDEKLL